MTKATSVRRFIAPFLVFFFAFILGFSLKYGLDHLSVLLPAAEPVSGAIDSYLEVKYAQRFVAVRAWIDPLWGVFLLNTITYSMNVWLGPMCFWLTTLFKPEPTPKIVRGFTDSISRLLEVSTRKSPTELLFLYLAPLTLVFWVGFDGGLFNNVSFFFQPHAWLEFFVAFYAASLGLSLSEVSFKTVSKHFLVLILLIFLAAVLEYPLIVG